MEERLFVVAAASQPARTARRRKPGDASPNRSHAPSSE